MRFDFHVGIDYSGAETAWSRLQALQVYVADDSGEPQRLEPEEAGKGRRNWNRHEIAERLIAWAREERTFIAGIDHGFGFPASYSERHGLADWPTFLSDFVQHWPTDAPNQYVDFIRMRQPPRVGANDEYRLTENWTSNAKSVFQFDVQGQVAKSTHAGLPWLKRIRDAVGERIHFWPFDGWVVPSGKCVLAEVYPSLVRRRYPRGERTVHQQDAYAVARWLREFDERETLAPYFQPPLTAEERRIGVLEGWILGVQ